MKLVRTFIAGDTMQANFVRWLLEREGIPAMVLGENLHSLGGAIPIQGSAPTVWVREQDEQAAAAVIVKYEANEVPIEAASKAPWRCANCGELLEAQFTDCWKCGTPRGQAEPVDLVVEPLELHVPCSGCGYDLHTCMPNGVCPECAQPVVTSLEVAYGKAKPDELKQIEPQMLAAIFAGRRPPK